MTTKIAIDNLQQSVVDTIVQDVVSSASPKISNIYVANSSYAISNNTTVSTSGGYIVVIGTGFSSDSQVVIDNVAANSTTFFNSTTIGAQVGAKIAGTYNVYVIKADGAFAIGVNGITYSS